MATTSFMFVEVRAALDRVDHGLVVQLLGSDVAALQAAATTEVSA